MTDQYITKLLYEALNTMLEGMQLANELYANEDELDRINAQEYLHHAVEKASEALDTYEQEHKLGLYAENPVPREGTNQ